MSHKGKINQENDAAYSADFFCPDSGGKTISRLTLLMVIKFKFIFHFPPSSTPSW